MMSWARRLALASVSAIDTGTPPRLLDSSAAVMKAYSSMVSSTGTGDTCAAQPLLMQLNS